MGAISIEIIYPGYYLLVGSRLVISWQLCFSYILSILVEEIIFTSSGLRAGLSGNPSAHCLG